MKTNTSSNASAWGIKRCICPCEIGTKITYGGTTLQLSMYKLHKRGQQLFFAFIAAKFTLVLLSKIISKIRYSKSCILYHITYTTTEALLYQPLRFILTFKSNRSMVSFGRKHCKYDMHIVESTQHSRNNTINSKEIRQCCFNPTYFHAAFLGIAFKSFVDDEGYCTYCL